VILRRLENTKIRWQEKVSCLFGFLIYGPLPFILSVFISIPAHAQKPEFQFIKCENNQVSSKIVIADSLPRDLVDNINKGIPVLIFYKIGLWNERSGWFDNLCKSIEITYKIRYDPWEKRYSVIQNNGDIIIEYVFKSEREVWDVICSSGLVTISLENPSGYFYLTGDFAIKIMSFSNYKEVESWLKGEISEAGKPKLNDAPDKVGEFMFNMALKISGLKNISKNIRSQNFEIKELSPIIRQ
jgi:hypothetical protein